MVAITRHDVPWELEQILELLRWPVRPPSFDELPRLEAELAEAVGAAHAVLVPSGSAGLAWALAAVAPEGGEVVVPRHAHPGLLAVLRAAGCQPRLAAVDSQTRLLDPAGLSAALSPRTRAIVVAHLYGRPCDVPGLREVAPGIPLIGDGAHGLGAGLPGQRVGGIEEACAFSFRSGKPVVCGWGGAVTTQDATIARRIRQHLAGARAASFGRVVQRVLPVLADLAALRRPVFANAVLPAFRALDRMAPGRLEDFWTGKIGLPLPVALTPEAFPPILARLARQQLRGLESRVAAQVANARALFARYPEPLNFRYPPDRDDGASHLCLAVDCADAYRASRELRALGVDSRVDYLVDLEPARDHEPVRVLHLPNHFRLEPTDMEVVASTLRTVDGVS